jgi:hypothetical protein
MQRESAVEQSFGLTVPTKVVALAVVDDALVVATRVVAFSVVEGDVVVGTEHEHACNVP